MAGSGLESPEQIADMEKGRQVAEIEKEIVEISSSDYLDHHSVLDLVNCIEALPCRKLSRRIVARVIVQANISPRIRRSFGIRNPM